MIVLYVVNHVDWFWSHRFTLAIAAKNKGHTVYVAVPNAREHQALFEKHGFHLISFNNAGIVASGYAIRKIVKSTSPDIVHAITLKYAFITACATYFLRRQPFLCYTIAGLGYLYSYFDRKAQLKRKVLTPFFKMVFKRGRFMFQNNDDKYEFLMQGIVKDNQCTLVPGSGVDLSKYTYQPESHTDSPLVLFPARLLIEKGIYEFFDAARVVHKKNPHIRFEIVGDVVHAPNAISQDDLNKLIADSPVIWRGKVDNMHKKLIETNIVVYPSYYREGVPKALLEATATGRAIITTDHVGCRDVVSDEQNGLLIPIRDANALADAIMVLADNFEQRQAMGQVGRRMAKEKFDVNIVIKATLDIYEMAKTASISTATLKGKDEAPTANRAWRPLFPIT